MLRSRNYTNFMSICRGHQSVQKLDNTEKYTLTAASANQNRGQNRGKFVVHRLIWTTPRHLIRQHEEASSYKSIKNDVLIYRDRSSDLIKQKFNDAYSFYEQFSHMDEVREAHDKVIFIQVNAFCFSY